MTKSPGGFHFEIWGRVQGVFFRKHTQKQAGKLRVAGWIRNTAHGSVEGEVASTLLESREEMQQWLFHERQLSDRTYARYESTDRTHAGPAPGIVANRRL